MKGILVAVLAFSAFAPTEGTKLGAGVSLKEATPIAAVVAKPKDFVGKTIRVDGVATAVCTEMGCWMAVEPSAKAKGTVVRLKVEDGAIVFPISAKGKRVSAEGVFEAIAADHHGRDAAEEHAKQDAAASQQYQIKATGAVIH
jgi:uncharacterized protein DUF4920